MRDPGGRAHGVPGGEQHHVHGGAESLRLDQPRGLLLVDAVGNLDEVDIGAGVAEVIEQLQERLRDQRHRLPVGGGEPAVGEVEHPVGAGVDHHPVVASGTGAGNFRDARPHAGSAEPVHHEMDSGGLAGVHRRADHGNGAAVAPGWGGPVRGRSRRRSAAAPARRRSGRSAAGRWRAARRGSGKGPPRRCRRRPPAGSAAGCRERATRTGRVRSGRRRPPGSRRRCAVWRGARPGVRSCGAGRDGPQRPARHHRNGGAPCRRSPCAWRRVEPAGWRNWIVPSRAAARR